MKLTDKHGWGLSVEIIFIFLFICCLLFAIYYINKAGLLQTPEYIYDGNDKTEVETKDTTYKDLEDDLKTAARIYVNREYGEIGEDTLIITVSNLKELRYIDKISDPDSSSKECSGYVEVQRVNESKVSYKPYIKCSKYYTEGYVKRKDI